jgi:hypothetical protein
MRGRTAFSWEGDYLLARTTALVEESRRLLAEVEEQIRRAQDLCRHSRELRAARVTLLRRAPFGEGRPGLVTKQGDALARIPDGPGRRPGPGVGRG